MDWNTVSDQWYSKWLRQVPSQKTADKFQSLLETEQVCEIGEMVGCQLLVSRRNSQRRLALLTSRIGRDVSRLAGVYHEMAQIVRRARAEDAITLFADAHLAPIVRRLAESHGIATTKISFCRTLASFWRRLSAWDGDCLLTSPPQSDTVSRTVVPTCVAVALRWADELHVPWIRPQSSLAETLAVSLRKQQSPPVWIYAPFFPLAAGLDLRSAGAQVVDTGKPIPRPTLSNRSHSWPKADVLKDVVNRWTMGREGLVHCVRGTTGLRLPELSTGQLDCLLGGVELGCSSPGDTLKKIIHDKRIYGSSKAIRGGHRVVCFSSTPLHELANLHEFRRGRQRWDFSPFGIWIDRQWLVHRGARPVVYGDDTVWEQLPSPDRPWFQCRGNGARTGAGAGVGADWTRENEWRVSGDVSLDGLPTDSAFVLVATGADTRWLQTGCRWKVVALDEND
ncbi:MAG TPA: hypothetical protein EYQ75_12180 [Planctomycetaceae bacterium]|nr:hypothetical protein [Planctomycetaceae bacterium]